MSVLFQGTDLNFFVFWGDYILTKHILFLIFLSSLGLLLIWKVGIKVEDEEGSDYEDDTLSDYLEDSDEVWSNDEESGEESGEELPFLYFSRTCRSNYFNELQQKELSIWKKISYLQK